MNGIIFGEGKNDVDFLLEAFARDTDFYPISFIAEEIDPRDRLQRESKVIRDLISKHGDEAILVKSEQGKPQLKEHIVSFLNELIGKPAFFSLVIDLDGTSHQALVNELDEMVEERYGSESSITTLNELSAHSDFVRLRCEAVLAGTYSDTFGVIAFHDSLEDAVGIRGVDNREQCRQKIRDYLNRDSEIKELVLGGLL